MDSTRIFGLLLVGLSAVLVASHWQQWRQRNRRDDARFEAHAVRTLRRRTVASSLLALIGFALMAFDSVPQTPISITAYLLALVLMTCWILWLAALDFFAARRFQHERQLDELAEHLRRAERDVANPQSDAPAGRR